MSIFDFSFGLCSIISNGSSLETGARATISSLNQITNHDVISGPIGPNSIPQKLGELALRSLTDSFLDNFIMERVTPVAGAVVYCDLGVALEHSGIYIGDNQIVHLNGNGKVEAVSGSTFLKRLGGLNPAMTIYVSSNSGIAVGSEMVAQNAISQVGTQLDYNILTNNCHRFCAGCLTDDFNNSVISFRSLKAKAQELLNASEWRAWDR